MRVFFMNNRGVPAVLRARRCRETNETAVPSGYKSAISLPGATVQVDSEDRAKLFIDMFQAMEAQCKNHQPGHNRNFGYGDSEDE